jgi:hypothetical protein
MLSAYKKPSSATEGTPLPNGGVDFFGSLVGVIEVRIKSTPPLWQGFSVLLSDWGFGISGEEEGE